ncbi:unnamed protein product [Musa textilis]
MVSDDPSTTINESNVAAESTFGGKKNQSGVPKKIHKAEREKLKRDQLNELFLEVTTERNELKDENTTSEAEISQLQMELQGRSRSNPTWSDNIISMAPAQPQPIATGLPMLHRPLQHISGGKNKHSTTNVTWAFPGDETTCQISHFVGVAAGSAPLDFSPAITRKEI